MTNSAISLNVFSDDEIMFRDEVRKFAQSKLKPLVAEMDAKAGNG